MRRNQRICAQERRTSPPFRRLPQAEPESERYSYLTPRVHECIDSLSNKPVFSMLEGSSVYWQIEIEEAGKEKTAFTLYQGLYCFIRMPLIYKIPLAHFNVPWT